MKIIVSHDVDHILLKEHWRDTFVPGLAKRTTISILRRQISPLTGLQRFTWRLNRIQELQNFNHRFDIPATYFFGMRSGLNLSYHWKAAKPLIAFLENTHSEIGLHGMSFDNASQMKEEKQRLESLLQTPLRGIRNHYLRRDTETLDLMASLGYQFDSTFAGLKNPWLHKGIVEIPISLMDVELLQNVQQSPTAWLTESWRRIRQAEELGLPYFVINFHDIYYSNGWPLFKAWYEQFISQLVEQDYRFTTFNVATTEFLN